MGHAGGRGSCKQRHPHLTLSWFVRLVTPHYVARYYSYHYGEV